MMTSVIDLASRRPNASVPASLLHPAGVILPLDNPGDATLLVPEVRKAISAGRYSSELIQLLPKAVQPGDRVLVIGAGLGLVSTLIAKYQRVARVLALEANVALMPYLRRVHTLNGVSWIETLNAVPALGKTERVPFFVRRDVRTSSLLPKTDAWQQVMMVPVVDLNLLVADEAISLIVCESPTASARVLAEFDPGPVQRIAIGDESSTARTREEADLVALLAQRGFVAAGAGGALLFSRDASTARSLQAVH